MLNIGESFEGWSRAVAINDHGVVIGSRLRGHVMSGFIWSQEGGATDIVGLSGRAFYPTAINDTGLVVGEGDEVYVDVECGSGVVDCLGLYAGHAYTDV